MAKRGEFSSAMKIQRARPRTTEQTRRPVNVKHRRATPQIEPTGFRCRVLEIRVSAASTFTILLANGNGDISDLFFRFLHVIHA